MGQLSHRVDIPFPLFDADNHLYEPPEAMTKYLPKEYKDIVQYVEINGRTKIALKGVISNYIPNPTFSVSPSRGPGRSTSSSETPTARASASCSVSRCAPFRRSSSPRRGWRRWTSWVSTVR